MKKTTLSFLLLLITLSCIYAQSKPLKREFRGAWIVTGKNIDYPSKKNLTVAQQKKEFTDLLDLYQRNGINAIVFQVRPASDAFYESKLEPWSEWLTGTQGQAPTPKYDPLKFMIEEAHKRDMEFHAWFNPFRAVFTTQYADVCKTHISVTRPKWCFSYTLHKYLNPGLPEVREYITKVIMDVVNRYDIDGVHFDDYFYPYPEKEDGKVIPIPDNEAYNKYKGKFNNVADWRRNNVDVFIENTYKSIKAAKPYVKFGIGTFGIWRNKQTDKRGSNTLGFESYDGIYCDMVKWLEKGWVDYVAPQIYWYIGQKNVDFKVVTDWWGQNTFGRHFYVGHSVSSWAGGKDGWSRSSEMFDQIRYQRSSGVAQGSIFYSTAPIKKNPNGFNDSLQRDFYRIPSFMPTMPWLDNVPPPVPNIHKKRVGKEMLVWWDQEMNRGKAANDTTIFYVIYKFKGEKVGDLENFDNRITVTDKRFFTVQRKKRFIWFGTKYTYAVTAFDRMHNESTPATVIIKMKE